MPRLADEIMETEASMAAANAGAERLFGAAESPPSPAPAMRDLALAAETLNLAASHVLDCDEAGDSGAQSDEWQEATQALANACDDMAKAIAENRDAITIKRTNRLVGALERLDAPAAPTMSELVAALGSITDRLEDIIDVHIYDGDEPADAPERVMVAENRVLIALASRPSSAPDRAARMEAALIGLLGSIQNHVEGDEQDLDVIAKDIIEDFGLRAAVQDAQHDSPRAQAAALAAGGYIDAESQAKGDWCWYTLDDGATDEEHHPLAVKHGGEWRVYYETAIELCNTCDIEWSA